MAYKIREVDGDEEELVLRELHHLTFDDAAPMPDFNVGYWWIAYLDREAVAFLGLMQSTLYPEYGYFNRVGVIYEHRGHGLQLKMMKCMEAKARALLWQGVISDTRDNPASGNNFISMKYKMWDPPTKWALVESVYWKKEFNVHSGVAS